MNQKKPILIIICAWIVAIFVWVILNLFPQAEYFSQTKDSGRIKDVASLIAAVENGNNGDTILLTRGIFELQKPLLLKPGMSIVGVGEQTIITAAPTWQPSINELPKVENPDAYLFHLEGISDLKISNMTLTGENLHGAIYANDVDGLELSNLHIEDFLWSSVRSFRMNHFRVHDNKFVDAGGKHRWTGGALYMNWTQNSEFWNNKIYASKNNPRKFFGFKGRKGTNLRFHHNDVGVNFSFEFPFENDKGIEIDRNYFAGVVSIPKHGGGIVPKDRLTYHIHHNWFKKSYSLEWACNSVEVNNNFFDFETTDDKGNLITNHGKVLAPGFTSFHDNNIKNPALGLFWSRGVYNQFYFYNNHVKANNLTKTDGFFGLNPSSDFSTIEIKNNIITNIAENPRPLMRNEESYAATIENNKLENISDTSAYLNPETDTLRGLLNPLYFEVGAYGQHTVDDWNVIETGFQSRWDFDNVEDTQIIDLSGHNAHGTLLKGTTVTQGISGQALNFDGVDDRMEIPAIDFSGNALSITAWINPNSFTVRSPRIVSKASSTKVKHHYWMLSTYPKGNDTRLRFRLKTNGKTSTFVASKGSIPVKTWTHIAVTWDGSRVKLYQNGIEVGSFAKKGNLDTNPATKVAIGNQPVKAGNRPFKGLIDNVRLYNRALSEREIQLIANNK